MEAIAGARIATAQETAVAAVLGRFVTILVTFRPNYQIRWNRSISRRRWPASMLPPNCSA